MSKYRVFTVSEGQVTEGARVEALALKGVGIEVPAVIVGEEGRNRSRGAVTIGGGYAGWP